MSYHLTKAEKSKTLKLRRQGLTYKQIGEVFGITNEAVRVRLKAMGKDGRILKTCYYCKKKKDNCNKNHCGWKRICLDCFEKKKRKRKYKWSCNYPKCIECGTTKRVHNSRGRCHLCSHGDDYRTRPEVRKARFISTRKWQKANQDKVKISNARAVKRHYARIKKRRKQNPAFNEECLKKQRAIYYKRKLKNN